MGSWHSSRPWPVLPPSPFGLPRTSRDGALILRLPRPSRRAAFGRAPQDEADRRTRLLSDEVDAWDGRFCCKQQRIYKAPLMQTPDAFGRRAQFQLWIFSYHIFARLPNRTLSRVMSARSHFSPLPCGTRRRSDVHELSISPSKQPPRVATVTSTTASGRHVILDLVCPPFTSCPARRRRSGR